MTLLELLVQPYRDQKEELAQKIFALTSTYPKIERVPVSMSLADRAAELCCALSPQHAGRDSTGNGNWPQGNPLLRE